METFQAAVKYLPYTIEATAYDTGLVDYHNLDNHFKGVTIRNKVVLKFDISSYYECYFEKETIIKYRPAIMMMAKGLVTDPNTLSAVIMDLIKNDSVFRQQIVSLFYSCPDNVSFGFHIMNTLAKVPIQVEEEFRSFFRGKPSVVICNNDGYLYFSIEDLDKSPLLPYRIDCEVLSNVKNWRGTFTTL